MFRVDLNSDLGESFGSYKIGMDEEVIKLVTSANIACGSHAGDPVVMDKTVGLAAKAGIGIGAHPGYPDLQGFGRRSLNMKPEEAYDYVMFQVGALNAFCKKHGVKLAHVKPHGALYNTAAKDYKLALAIANAVKDIDKDLILLGLAGSESIKAAEDIGLKTSSEVFADRAYEEDGTLRARTYPDAMIEDEDECARRVIRMIKEGKVQTVTGRDIDIKADSVCVHGDGEHALAFVRKLRNDFKQAGIEVCSLSELQRH